eukprot:7627809-Pyramimonas_sp.AAC.1
MAPLTQGHGVLHQGPRGPPSIRSEVLGLALWVRTRLRASAGAGKGCQLLPEHTGCPAENQRGLPVSWA